MVDQGKNLQKLSISMIYALLTVTTSLTIITSCLYEVPVPISLTIIVLHLLVCNLCGGLLGNGLLFKALKRLGKTLFVKGQDAFVNYSQARKARTLENTKRILELELEKVLQDQKGYTRAHVQVKDIEREATEISSSNLSPSVLEASEHLASERLAYNNARIVEKVKELHKVERQIWDSKRLLNGSKEAAVGAVITEDTVNPDLKPDKEYNFVCKETNSCGGSAELEQELIALRTKKAQIENDYRREGAKRDILISKHEKACARFDSKHHFSNSRELWLATYSFAELIFESRYVEGLNRQENRLIDHKICVLESELWYAREVSKLREAVTSFLRDRSMVPNIPSDQAKYQEIFLRILRDHSIQMREKKLRLLGQEAKLSAEHRRMKEKEICASKSYELSQRLYQEVGESMPSSNNLDGAADSRSEEHLVAIDIRDLEEEHRLVMSEIDDVDSELDAIDHVVRRREELIRRETC